mmetsp:Transcript_13509/g.28527  ORF Transcript_13509/g.28527 Transcript_13509/m.28527 type:complete len:214 (-) Transcript_13509:427-1068(-)
MTLNTRLLDSSFESDLWASAWSLITVQDDPAFFPLGKIKPDRPALLLSLEPKKYVANPGEHKTLGAVPRHRDLSSDNNTSGSFGRMERTGLWTPSHAIRNLARIFISSTLEILLNDSSNLAPSSSSDGDNDLIFSRVRPRFTSRSTPTLFSSTSVLVTFLEARYRSFAYSKRATRTSCHMCTRPVKKSSVTFLFSAHNRSSTKVLKRPSFPVL